MAALVTGTALSVCQRRQPCSPADTAALLTELLRHSIHPALSQGTEMCSVSHCSKETHALKGKTTDREIVGLGREGNKSPELFGKHEVTLSHQPQVVLCSWCPRTGNTNHRGLACPGSSQFQESWENVWPDNEGQEPRTRNGAMARAKKKSGSRNKKEAWSNLVCGSYSCPQQGLELDGLQSPFQPKALQNLMLP